MYSACHQIYDRVYCTLDYMFIVRTAFHRDRLFYERNDDEGENYCGKNKDEK